MDHMVANRANGRAANQMRPVSLEREVMKNALGSCMVEFHMKNLDIMILRRFMTWEAAF